MSEKRSQGESPQLADTEAVSDGSDGSNVESWLRKAARVPDGDTRTLLPQAGQVISGKYRIEEQLGKGGMGAVYRATHVVSDKQVALKWMLRPASDERATQRFTREARAAGRIDHPNVVDVYDIGQEGDAGYLVMELLRGESLRSRLAHGPLGPTAAVDLLLPAMRGVAAAHREGVIHRDLKPDNIFLCRAPDGSEREAKVLDFGISTVSTPEPDGKTTLTKEGTVLGTPSYMSPEQLQNVRTADARTDVYAFGVILYEALTGRLPFVADSYSALVLAIANTKPRPARELRPDLPVELERVIMRAMEKDREQRLQSMDALVAAVLPFASVKSAGSGEHASIEERTTLPSVRARSGRSVGLVLAVAVALLSGVAWWMLRGSEPVAAPGDRPERATEPAVRAAAAVAPSGAPSEAQPAAEAPAVPEVPAAPAPSLAEAPPPKPAVPAGTAVAAPVDRPRRPARAAQPPPLVEEAAAPVAPSAQRKPPAAAARSGSISLDEL